MIYGTARLSQGAKGTVEVRLHKGGAEWLFGEMTADDASRLAADLADSVLLTSWAAPFARLPWGRRAPATQAAAAACLLLAATLGAIAGALFMSVAGSG